MDKCDNLLQNWEFNKAKVLVAGDTPNKSVHIPFCRNSYHEVIYCNPYNDEDINETVTLTDLNSLGVIKNINTLNDWLREKDSITRGIYAKTIGTIGNSIIRDDLIAMKDRIIRDESSRVHTIPSATVGGKRVTLRDHLQLGDTEAALVYIKTIINDYYNDNDIVWSKDIDRLISAATGALRDTFSLISSPVDRAYEVKPVYTEELSYEQTADGVNAWKRMFDELTGKAPPTVMSIIFSEGEPILTDVDKSIVTDITSCPLNFLNYPELITRLSERICSFVSVESIADSYRRGSPMTHCPTTGKLLY